jgi:hypothetical protein
MTSKKTSVNPAQKVNALVLPAECLSEIVQACSDYLIIAEQEKTKRRAIEAWEKKSLAEIKAKSDFLIGYLERSFDERAKNFQSLFEVVDHAIASDNNQQLSLALNAIVDLAKSSPFKDLADLSTVQKNLENPDHVWEF